MDGTSSQGAEAEVPASARLQASKERILKLWVGRVRQDIPAARAQDEPRLRNSLPRFLEHLVAALAAEPRWRVSLEALNDVSREHGKQRSSLEEYSLHQMLQEYQLLREVIFQVLEQKAPVTTAERDLILTAIEQGMAEAAACFAQFSQSRERSAEERYRLIIENVKDHAIIRTSPDGRIFDWNSGAENIFQYREDEVRGKDCRLLFTPEDLAQGAAEQEMKTALATGKAEDKRWHVKKDGSRFFANGVMNPLRDATGRVLGFVKVLRDDTERATAEAELRMLKLLTEQSSDFIGVATPDGRALFLNEAGRKMVGLEDPEEVLKTQLMDYFLEEDKPFVREVILPTQEREGRWAGEFRFRHFKTGEAIPVHYNQFVIRDEKGSISGVATVTRDLRGEKQAEQRFTQIANALPQIIWTATPDFVVDWYNDWWFKYLGLPRGTRWDDPDTLPMHPEDVERTRPRLKEAVETGKDFLMEQRFRCGSDGQYRWHLVRGVPLRDADGRIVKWIGANTDIHDQKVFTARLEEERELRERFVATLSHDLRTPLTAAKLNAHMVARKAGDPTVLYKLAARISENLDRADQMISDLLDANRIRAGEPLPIEVSKCELSALAQGTLEELSLLHGDRFVLDAPELLQGYWSCSGIRRIIENLCNNAIKYGARDRPVTVRLAQSGQDEVSISVHNWGSPIAPEEQKALFQLYRRAGSAQVRAQKGWGLGLTLVEGLAKAHRGSVRVESTEEAGTTFTVSLARDMRQ